MEAEEPNKKLKISIVFLRDYRKGKIDWSSLVSGGYFIVVKWTRNNVTIQDENALFILFRNENGQLLSWGSIRIRQHGN